MVRSNEVKEEREGRHGGWIGRRKKGEKERSSEIRKNGRRRRREDDRGKNCWRKGRKK